MKAFAIAAAALLCSTGCASLSTDAPANEALQSISYETTPCPGPCPVYRFSVRRDGTGTFEGWRHTAVTGERAFRATPEQFAALVRHLEPVRPDSGTIRIQGETCPDIEWNDHPAVEVSWRHAGGEVQQLHYYFGCAPERLRELAERLGTAPFLLPIGEMIGSR